MHPVHDLETRVWLPLRFIGQATSHSFTPLAEDQLDQLIESLNVPVAQLACPEPLGLRQLFAWRLAEDVKNGTGTALEEFHLLLEGALYGLLETKAFDLRACGFQFDKDVDRFLTVLRYRSAPQARTSVAGLLSPMTLVCPAGNWEERDQLEGRVNQLRFADAGNHGRALLADFLKRLPDAFQFAWSKAARKLLEKHQARLFKPVTVNQRNIGPFLLKTAEDHEEEILFFPTHSEHWLDRIEAVFHAESFEQDSDFLVAWHNQQDIARILIPAAANPVLGGMGNVELTGKPLPGATNAEQDEFLDKYVSQLGPVIHAYAEALAGDNLDYHLPDSLRVAIQRWGPGITEALQGGTSAFVYGERFERDPAAPRPHHTFDSANYFNEDGNLLYVAETSEGKLAYYIESYGGRAYGELTALGYALWCIYRGRCWDNREGQATDPRDGSLLLRIKRGRLAVPMTVVPRRPDPNLDVVTWRQFLFHLQSETADGLLRTAINLYIQQFGLERVSSLPGATVRRIKIANHDYYIPD